MSKYYEKLNETIKEYFKVLSKDFPEFLYEYIDTPPMQRIGKIGCGCGTDYTKVFNNKFFYTNLEHSIGVALIVWNFTKDKKQTLAGLFHDIATPVFKHSIDFMNGDYEKQESTEELTTRIINESQEIMKLLKRDGIKVEDDVKNTLKTIKNNGNNIYLITARFKTKYAKNTKQNTRKIQNKTLEKYKITCLSR